MDPRAERIYTAADYVKSQCKVLGLGTPDSNYVKQLATAFVDETVQGTKLLGR